MTEPVKGRILGIDLGTTNSVMAVMKGGEPHILENSEGSRITPSVVALSKSGERLVGQTAKRQAITNPKNTIFSIKRLIGRKFNDPETQRDKKLLPYEIRESSSGGVEVKMGEKWYRPAEISAMILQKLKHDAEERLGEKIDRAVITVPAYFDDSQRKATKDAGEIAGFKVERVLNEPTASALAYGLNKKKDEKVVVYDFGGGTFDVSVLDIGEDTVEVKATGGDTHLGGDDFDQKIIEWIVSEFKKESGIDLSKDQLALQRLKDAAEKAKHELSSTMETEINIPFITSDSSGPKHLMLKLTRAQLESLVEEYIERSIEILRKIIAEAKLKISDIDEVVLVGGQTKMPAIQKRVEEVLGRKPYKDINPDEVVAFGAAIQAGILQGEVQDILLLDVTPLSLGIETLGGINTILIPKNTTVPVRKSRIFTTAADNQTSVEVHVLQGERQMAADNKSLGRFILDGIPPAPRGVPQIEVTFDIDANGILDVTAMDKKTGKKQSIRIEASSGLTQEEIEKMKEEAKKHAEEDKKRRELAELRNNADTLIYSAEKTLKEYKDKIKQEIFQDIEEKIKNLKEKRNGEDVQAMKQAIDELSAALQQVGSEIYKDQGNQGNKNSQGPKEAEYQEPEDKDKKA